MSHFVQVWSEQIKIVEGAIVTAVAVTTEYYEFIPFAVKPLRMMMHLHIQRLEGHGSPDQALGIKSRHSRTVSVLGIIIKDLISIDRAVIRIDERSRAGIIHRARIGCGSARKMLSNKIQNKQGIPVEHIDAVMPLVETGAEHPGGPAGSHLAEMIRPVQQPDGINRLPSQIPTRAAGDVTGILVQRKCDHIAVKRDSQIVDGERRDIYKVLTLSEPDARPDCVRQVDGAGRFPSRSRHKASQDPCPNQRSGICLSSPARSSPAT